MKDSIQFKEQQVIQPDEAEAREKERIFGLIQKEFDKEKLQK